MCLCVVVLRSLEGVIELVPTVDLCLCMLWPMNVVLVIKTVIVYLCCNTHCCVCDWYVDMAQDIFTEEEGKSVATF